MTGNERFYKYGPTSKGHSQQMLTRFLQLKPACVALLSPSVWTSTNRNDSSDPLLLLHCQLENLSNAANGGIILAALAHYVTFPLLSLLKSPISSSAAVEKALRILCILLNKSDTFPVSLFREFLAGLPLAISNGYFGKPTNRRVAEETKLVAVESVVALMGLASRLARDGQGEQL